MNDNNHMRQDKMTQFVDNPKYPNSAYVPNFNGLYGAASELENTENNIINSLAGLQAAGGIEQDLYNIPQSSGDNISGSTDDYINTSNLIEQGIAERESLMNQTQFMINELNEAIRQNEATIRQNEQQIEVDKTVEEEICVGEDEDGNPIYEHNPAYDVAQQEIADLTAENAALEQMNATLRTNINELEVIYHEYESDNEKSHELKAKIDSIIEGLQNMDDPFADGVNGSQSSGPSDDNELTYQYTYNPDGTIASATGYDSDGNIVSITNYEFDESGNLQKATTVDADNNLLYVTTKTENGDVVGYGYDENGNVNEEKYYNSDTKATSVKTYGYDENGNQYELSKSEYDSNGQMLYAVEMNEFGDITDCIVGQNGYIPSDVEGSYIQDGASIDVSNGVKHISYNQRVTYNENGEHEVDGWTNIRKDNQGSYDHLHQTSNWRGGFAPVVDSNGNIMIAPPRTIKTSGCGSTSTATALSTMYGDTKTPDGEPLTPDYLAEMLPAQSSNEGMEFLETICEHYGIGYDKGNNGINFTKDNHGQPSDAVDNLLQAGGKVIKCVGGGSHYIAITDMKEENGQKYYFVCDPDVDPKNGTTGEWYLADMSNDPSKSGRLQWNQIAGSGQTGFIAPLQEDGDTRSIYDFMGVDPPVSQT